MEMPKKGPLLLPTDIGVHIFSVFAEWQIGDASYAFVVEVVEQ